MDGYKNLFTSLREIDPPADLADKINQAMTREETRWFWRQFLVYGLVLAASLVGFLPSLSYLRGEVTQSGFYQYLSLLFSDSAAVLTYWNRFLFSLLESLPVIGTVLVGTSLWAGLLSLKRIAKTSRIIKLSYKYGL